MSDLELRRLWNLVKLADEMIGHHIETQEPIDYQAAQTWLAEAARVTPSLKRVEFPKPNDLEN